jgi:hypothetical protein
MQNAFNKLKQNSDYEALNERIEKIQREDRIEQEKLDKRIEKKLEKIENMKMGNEDGRSFLLNNLEKTKSAFESVENIIQDNEKINRNAEKIFMGLEDPKEKLFKGLEAAKERERLINERNQNRERIQNLENQRNQNTNEIQNLLNEHSITPNQNNEPNQRRQFLPTITLNQPALSVATQNQNNEINQPALIQQPQNEEEVRLSDDPQQIQMITHKDTISALQMQLKRTSGRLDSYQRSSNLNDFTVHELRYLAQSLNIPYNHNDAYPRNNTTSQQLVKKLQGVSKERIINLMNDLKSNISKKFGKK